MLGLEVAETVSKFLDFCFASPAIMNQFGPFTMYDRNNFNCAYPPPTARPSSAIGVVEFDSPGDWLSPFHYEQWITFRGETYPSIDTLYNAIRKGEYTTNTNTTDDRVLTLT